MPLIIGGRELATDKEGYLKNLSDWNEDVAQTMARNDAVTLTPSHWEIINFLREYYAQYGLIPPMRALTKAIEKRFGAEKSSSRYLYNLFPEGPAKQASRYAGLPKPRWCI